MGSVHLWTASFVGVSALVASVHLWTVSSEKYGRCKRMGCYKFTAQDFAPRPPGPPAPVAHTRAPACQGARGHHAHTRAVQRAQLT